MRVKLPGNRKYWLVALAWVSIIAFLLLGLYLAQLAQQITLTFVGDRVIADKHEDFTEVSGLSPDGNGGFWAVSDNTSRLFVLDQKGNIDPKLDLKGDTDLEGIAFDAERNLLYAVREQSAEILVFGPGGTLKRVPLLGLPGAEEIAPYFEDRNANNGLEGITVEPRTGTVFIVKEAHPRMLIEVSPDLSAVRRSIILSSALGFRSELTDDSKLDVSGLAFDPERKGFWITSDTGSAVFFFSIETAEARAWSLRHFEGKRMQPVENAEGVALAPDGATLHVVTDDGQNSRILTYRIE